MKIKEGYILRNIADEWIIVPVGARIHDFNGLMTVNDTGAFLWKLLVNGCTKQQLIDNMANEYDAGREIIESDVDEFIRLLIDGGVLDH